MDITDHLEIIICPACKGNLEIADNRIKCTGCLNEYKIEDDIPLLFIPTDWDSSKKDVTDVISSFYEKNPFPNYEDLENAADLIQKSQKGIFARLLNEQIPFNIRVLEVGCGTGQLSNFLSTSERMVLGADLCLNSLRLAQNFKKKNSIDRASFFQMNLFRPIFKEKSFPLVICSGVLHHTSDPFAGFQSISRLVKKGGYIIIGLYNKYGRIFTDIRRFVFRLSKDRFKLLDPRLREGSLSDLRKNTWFQDQYKNPHESKHTFMEVLEWFEKTGFDFVGSIPKLQAFENISEQDRLFAPSPKGNLLDQFLVQTRLLLSGSREGGFFIMIGKKRQS